MPNHKFSDTAREALAKAGWTEGRKTDIADFEHRAREAAAGECEAACRFLQEFGGLEVEIPDSGENCLNTRFDRFLNKPGITNYVDEPALTLFYVGLCDWDFQFLLMDATGRVYRHVEMTSQNVDGISLYQIAESAEEAVEKLIQEGFNNTVVDGVLIAHWE